MKKTEKNPETPIQNKPAKKFVKNEYKIRVSLLDECSFESYINKSSFKGFYNLGKLIGFLLLITIPFVSYNFRHLKNIKTIRSDLSRKEVFSKPKFSQLSKKTF